MVPHSGLIISFMALLALAGVYKIADPTPTSGALRAAGIPGSTHLVRLLGAIEIGVGVIGIGWGGPIASAAAALLYGAFLVFVVEALRRRLPISSCGCLGATETPPTIAHVLVNAAGVVVLSLGAVVPMGTLGGIRDRPLLEQVAFALLTGATTYLLYGVIAVLPLRKGLARQTPVRLGAGGTER